MTEDPTRLRDTPTASAALRSLLRAASPDDASDDARARVAERLARSVAPAQPATAARKTG